MANLNNLTITKPINLLTSIVLFIIRTIKAAVYAVYRGCKEDTLIPLCLGAALVIAPQVVVCVFLTFTIIVGILAYRQGLR